jgi:hypothetical protein
MNQNPIEQEPNPTAEDIAAVAEHFRDRKPVTLRLPVGAVLRLPGGNLTVSSGKGREILLSGHCNAVVGQRMNIFGHLCQVVFVGTATMRLRAPVKVKFDISPLPPPKTIPVDSTRSDG